MTGVSVKAIAGEAITATVQDGFWSAWWPPGSSGGPFDATVAWTTADGASHTASLSSIYAYRNAKRITGNGMPSVIPVG